MMNNSFKKGKEIFNKLLNRPQLKEQRRHFSRFLKQILSESHDFSIVNGLSILKRISSKTANDIKKIINSIQYKAKFNKVLIESAERSKSLLHYVISLKDDITSVKELIILVLQSGVDINHLDEDGNTPLMYLLSQARENKYNDLEERIKFLVEHGADLNDSQGLPTFNLMNPLVSEGFIDNVVKKAKYTLQEKTKNLFNSRYFSGGIKRVSIYGSYAEIKLSSKAEKFPISEFLNDQFCIENGISEFSTFYGDEKSGMHGFMSADGVRHYFVTSSSYDMTLNWCFKGEKCSAIININENGVELKGGDYIRLINGDINKEVLAANKDVRINGLSLLEAVNKGRQEIIISNEYFRETSTPYRNVLKPKRSIPSITASSLSGSTARSSGFQDDLSNISYSDSAYSDTLNDVSYSDSAYSSSFPSPTASASALEVEPNSKIMMENNYRNKYQSLEKDKEELCEKNARELAKLANLEEKFQVLQRKLDEEQKNSKEGKEKMNSELMKKDEELSYIKQQLEDKTKQLDKLSSDIKQQENTLTEEIRIKDKQLEALNAERNEIRNKFITKEQELVNVIDRKRNDENKEIEELNNQLMGTEAEKDNLSRQVEYLQEKFNCATHRYDETIGKLNKENDELNKVNERIMHEYLDLNNKLNKQEKDIMELQAKENELHKKYEEVYKENEYYNEYYSEDMEKLFQLEDKLSARDAELDKQNQAMQGQQHEIEELKDENKSILDKLSNIQEVFKTTKLQLKEKEEMNKELNKWIEEQQGDYDKHLKFHTEKMQELKEKRQQVEKIKTKYGELILKLKKVEEDYDNLNHVFHQQNELRNNKAVRQSSLEKPSQIKECEADLHKQQKALLTEVQEEISNIIDYISKYEKSRMDLSSIENRIKPTLIQFLLPLSKYEELFFMEKRILSIIDVIDSTIQNSPREDLDYIELRFIQELVQPQLERCLQDEQPVPSLIEEPEHEGLLLSQCANATVGTY